LNNKAVTDYFDRKAANYEVASHSWLWSIARKTEANAVRRMMGTVDGRSFIDLGAGSGYYTRIFLALGAVDVMAVDMSAEMLSGMPPNVRTCVDDIATIKVDGTFERILCAGALEFVSEPVAVFKNARALAADSSRMVVLVPNANFLAWFYKFFHRSHGLTLNLFQPDTLCGMATLAGWNVENIERVFPFSLVASLSAR
jgi:SAM-dependent methyltransferase